MWLFLVAVVLFIFGATVVRFLLDGKRKESERERAPVDSVGQSPNEENAWEFGDGADVEVVDELPPLEGQVQEIDEEGNPAFVHSLRAESFSCDRFDELCADDFLPPDCGEAVGQTETAGHCQSSEDC